MVALKFLKKIRDKLDEYIENRELRSRQASFTQPPPHSWAPDPFEEEKNRRKSYDERFRRHTETDLNQRRIRIAANQKRPRRMSNNGLPNRGRLSEGNLHCPRKSRDVVARSGDENQERCPRKSDGELVRRRREDQRALRESDRPRASNDRVNRSHNDVPPVPPIPPQWLAEHRRSMPSSPRNPKIMGPQFEAGHRLQHEAPQKKEQKYRTVDWDALLKARNEQVRLAAEAKKRDEEEKRRVAEQKWKAAEQRRRAEEERTQINSRRFEAGRQREREKADKRRSAKEAEKKEHAARVQRENEERRLRAFGLPGGSLQPVRWPAGPTALATGGSKPQRPPHEKRDAKSVRAAAAINNVQEHREQKPGPPARRNSVPTRPQNEIMRNVPRKLAMLTRENLRAKAAVEDEDDDIDPLGRGIGDNMRTFLQGFALPTIYQSEFTPSMAEDDETKDKNKKPEDKNKTRKG